MARPKRKIRYEVFNHPLWWSNKLKRWGTMEELRVAGAKEFGTFRRCRTMRSALRAIANLPAGCQVQRRQQRTGGSVLIRSWTKGMGPVIPQIPVEQAG